MSVWSSDVSGEVTAEYRPPHRDGHSSLPALPRSQVTIAIPANRHFHGQNVTQGLPCIVDI